MPKIKLTSQGFQNVTGLIGSIEFEDGVSVENISLREAERLGALTSVVDADTGEELNVGKGVETRLRANDRKTRPSDTTSAPSTKDEESDADTDKDAQSDAGESTDVETDASNESEVEEPEVYTEAQLGDIADKEGMAGLRKVAEKFDVTDKSVRGLIVKILQAQAE